MSSLLSLAAQQLGREIGTHTSSKSCFSFLTSSYRQTTTHRPLAVPSEPRTPFWPVSCRLQGPTLLDVSPEISFFQLFRSLIGPNPAGGEIEVNASSIADISGNFHIPAVVSYIEIGPFVMMSLSNDSGSHTSGLDCVPSSRT